MKILVALAILISAYFSFTNETKLYRKLLHSIKREIAKKIAENNRFESFVRKFD